MFYWNIAILNDYLFISNSCNYTGLDFTLYWEQECIWKTDILKIFAKQAREVRSVTGTSVFHNLFTLFASHVNNVTELGHLLFLRK